MSKKIRYALFFAVTLCVQGVFAQNVTVTGRVSDIAGVPIPGANVIEKGTTNGASTDFDGNYSLSVSSTATLSFSYIGYQTQEIVVGNRTVINVTLQEDTQLLDEVVVTALGIKKEKKALSYSAQEIGADEVVRAANGNINTALQGKIAGVNITTQGGPGGNARLELRGPSSLTGNDQVLWVIDGVPFSQNNASDPGDLFGGTSNGGGLLDINPDDIETISVLKGGQAAALYGTRGANGVVLITTKSGGETSGLGISYTGSTTFSSAAYFLDLQDEYGQGIEGVYTPAARSSWGPRLDDQVRPGWTGQDLPYSGGNNLIEDFTRTAINTRHSVAVSKSTEKGKFRAAILSDKNEGIFNNNQIKKVSFDLRADYNVNPWLNVDAKVSYIRNQGQQRPEIGFFSFVSQLNRTPANIRTSELAPGFELVNGLPTEILFGPGAPTANPNPNNRNPYFVQEQQVNNDERHRMFGYLAANIKLADKVDLRLKYGLDFYNYNEVSGVLFPDNINPARPFYNTSKEFFKEENLEFLLRYNTDLNEDFTLGLSAGGNLMRNGSNTLSAESGRLATPNEFFLNAGTTILTRETFSNREIQSLYGFADLSFKDYLFLSVTARNDWSSALASAFTNNEVSYFYPSVGLSALISEMTEMPEWINYLKLRGSWAQLGKDTDPFLTNPTFELLQFPFNLLATETPNLLVNSNLQPEISTTQSIGAELRLFDSRFTLDATLYNERTENQILIEPLGESSGFTGRVTNAGLISNKGIELIAMVNPIRTNNFNLGLTFNIARNVSTLEEYITPEDDDEFHFFFRSNTIPIEVRATEGEKLGDIYGFAYERDAAGGVIVDADGLPVRTQERVKLGNIQADFTGSIGIDATYKNFSLSTLFGMQQGGDIYSLTEADATETGTALKTVSLGRDPFFAAGNQADGSANTQIVSPDAYWGRIGGRSAGINEEFIYDASFMKLTEMSLSYSFPSSILDKIGGGVVQNARLSVIGRNLFYLYRDTPGTVPDAGVYNSSFGAQAFDFSPVPVTRSWGLALNLNF